MSELWDELRRVQENRNRGQAASQDRYDEDSRRRLCKIMETKLRTAFIGALARFETDFGHLWGHGRPEEDLTDAEFNLRELWHRARTEVLNNGNTQLRGLQSEILQYTVRWNRHQLNLKV